MAAHTRQYEALFLLNPSYATGSWETAKGEVEHILHRANAEILHIRKWDERRLAYEIEGQKRGVYILAFFKCEGPKIAGIERDVQLSENILRCLVLKSDHIAMKDVEAMQPQQPVAEEHDTRAFRRAVLSRRVRAAIVGIAATVAIAVPEPGGGRGAAPAQSEEEASDELLDKA